MKKEKEVKEKLKEIKITQLCPHSPRAKSKIMALEWVLNIRPDLS